MINDTRVFRSLSGPPAWLSAARIFSLTVAVALAAGGALALFGQAQPEAPKPAKTVKENKPAAKPEGKTAGKYAVHQSLEMGGRITNTSGSDAMWSTLVNMGTGARVIGQSLEMHSTDTSKTKFFDNLNSSSFGYGGDPYDVTRLKFNKGRIYDFDGSFRRDRNYFDYNLLDNSLLSTSTAATPALVQEPDSLHLFNTVRRNTDTMVTLFPLSMVSVRAGDQFSVRPAPVAALRAECAASRASFGVAPFFT